MNINYKVVIDLGINVTSSEYHITDGIMHLSYSADDVVGYDNDLLLEISNIENSVDLTTGGGCELYNTAKLTIRNINNWVYYAKKNGCVFEGCKVTITAVKDNIDQILYIGGISYFTSNDFEVYITCDDLNQYIYDEDESNKIPRSVFNTCGGTEINDIRLIPQLEPFNLLTFYNDPSYRHELSCLEALKSPDGTQNVKNKIASVLSPLTTLLTVTKVNNAFYTADDAVAQLSDENTIGLICCESAITATNYTALGFSTLSDYIDSLNTGWAVDTDGMPRLAKIVSDGTLEKIIPLRGNGVNDYTYYHFIDEALNQLIGFKLSGTGYVNFYFAVLVPADDIKVGDTLCLTENHTEQNIEDEVDLITTATMLDSDYYDNTGNTNDFQFKNRTSSYNLCDVAKNEYQDTKDLTDDVYSMSSWGSPPTWETVGYALSENGPFVGNSFSNSIQTIDSYTSTTTREANLKIDHITRSNMRRIGVNNTGGSSSTSDYMAHKVTIPLDSSVIPLNLDNLENFKFCFSMGDLTAESQFKMGFISGGTFGDGTVLPATKVSLVKTRNSDFVSNATMASWTKDTTEELLSVEYSVLAEPFSTEVKSLSPYNVTSATNTITLRTTILSNDNRELSYPNLNAMLNDFDFERALFSSSKINAWTYEQGDIDGYYDSDDAEYYLVIEFNTMMYEDSSYSSNISQFFSLNFAGIANVVDVNDLKISAYTDDNQYDFNYIPAKMLNQVGLLSDDDLADYKNTGFNLDYNLPTRYSSSFPDGINNNLESVFDIIKSICSITPSKVVSEITGGLRIVNLFKLISQDTSVDYVISNFDNLVSDSLLGSGTKINFKNDEKTLYSSILSDYLPIILDTNYAEKLGLETVNEITTSLYLATNYQEITSELSYKKENILDLTLNWFALNNNSVEDVTTVITRLYNYLGDYLLYVGSDKERVSFDVSMESYLDNGYAVGDMIQLNDGVIYSDTDVMVGMISSIGISDVASNLVNIQCIQSIVYGDVIASFSFDPEYGETPLSVQFTDASFGTPITWSWYYKLNSEETWILFSNVQNPLFEFTVDGEYDIRLSVTSADDASVRTKYNAVKVGSEYVLSADFSVDTTNGEAPLTVNFTDNSTGSPDTWEWKIDGLTFSTLQNPTYVFNPYAGDTFDITLIVTRGDTISTKTYTDLIDVDTYSLETNETDTNLSTNDGMNLNFNS